MAYQKVGSMVYNCSSYLTAVFPHPSTRLEGEGASVRKILIARKILLLPLGVLTTCLSDLS